MNLINICNRCKNLFKDELLKYGTCNLGIEEPDYVEDILISYIDCQYFERKE